ncbi:hypothetical protein IHN63_00530 [Deinococcus sp. 6YEL10]|uniref:hypothetical protein n=1 Tax=Deinococcus sp. 6YEL10 TaxID=2745870 RepID=UPI001E53FABE|nr:hypothetical protein [Deinococcus sp. 6YEL10]MCD0159785.1 hypothetical protein [Deinococcus sp. 6YEL10]
MSAPSTPPFGRLSRVIRDLPERIRDQMYTHIAATLMAEAFSKVHWRIENSLFGDDEQKSPRKARENADYTLHGEAEQGGIRLDSSSGDEDGMRFGVHQDPLDNFGKQFAGRETRPLMESGQYKDAFSVDVLNSGDTMRIFLINDVGTRETTDAEGMQLWEVLEYGTGGTGGGEEGDKAGIPPRPHIGPALRDAAEAAAEQLAPEIRKFIISELMRGLR